LIAPKPGQRGPFEGDPSEEVSRGALTTAYGVQKLLIDRLPEHLEDRHQFAYNLVPKAMNAVFGSQTAGWETFKNPTTGKTWIRGKK
jgi:hypothetical protein